MIKKLIKKCLTLGSKPSKKTVSTIDAYNNCIYYTANITEVILGGNNVIFDFVTLYKVDIGSHSYVQKHSQIHNALIGKFCSIASDVKIGLGIHKTQGLSTHPAFYLKNTPLQKVFVAHDEFIVSKKVIIGNDVWIGTGVIILDGISIGTGAIIAAGAVVTKDVLPYQIVGGVPAKQIKMRFNEATVQKLLQSEWWLKSDEWLAANFKKLEHEIIS